MGWLRTIFLGDIGNRLDIADTERDIDVIRREVFMNRRLDESQHDMILRLQRENEQLELCVAAIVKSLQNKGIFSDEEVANLVEMIDDNDS